jgi:hypothetical protein
MIMQRAYPIALASLTLVAALAGGTASAQGTAPAAKPAAPATGARGVISGLVRDSAGQGLGGATIVVVDPRNGAEREPVSAVFNGRFAIPGLEIGVPYILKISKIDYYPVVVEGVKIPDSKVIRPEIVMYSNDAQKLERMTIRPGSKGSVLAKKTLEANEIAKAKVHSALDAIQRLRPVMLMPNRDICITNDSLSLYVDGIRRPVFNPRDDGMGARRLVTRQGNNRGQFYTTGRTNEEIVQDELSQIPAEDIAEVKFVSCDDYDNKILKRNAIWLLTKRYKANWKGDR